MSCPACQGDHISDFATKNDYHLSRCSECSLIFVDPLPPQQEIDDFYENYHKSKQYKDKITSKFKRAKRRLRPFGKPNHRRFLDVGCNLGFAAGAAAALGYESYGIDVDQDAITRAGQHFPEANFRYLSISELAATGELFDLIYCSEVIEHLLDPISFLKDLHKVMKPGAKLYLTTPDVGHYSLPSNKQKLIEWTTFRPPEHLLYFNKKSLALIFRRCGFKDIKINFNFKPTLKIIASR